MQKRMLKRILAGFCTVTMLSQTILETGIAAYAADGSDAGIVSEAEEAEALSEGEALPKEAVMEEETPAKEDAVAEEQTKKAPKADAAPEDAEEEDEAPEADELGTSIIIEGNVVKNKSNGRVYGTFSGGVFTIDKDLSAIDFGLFDNWEELTEIRFAEGAICTTIGTNTAGSNVEGRGAFKECKNLVKVDMTNAHSLTAIFPCSFQRCEKLKTVIFNTELQFIQKNSFEGCKGIEEIVFGENLLRIEECAFLDCSSLHKITIKNRNTECKTYGGGAAGSIFKGCAIDEFVLSTYTDEGEVKAIFPTHLFDQATFAEDATIVIPDNVLEITEGAFKSSNIAHVKLPKRLQKIAVGAFEGCASLAEIDFSVCDGSDGITLENNVFNGCRALTTLNLRPKSANGEDITFKKIGNGCFANAQGLKTLTLPNTVAREVTVNEENGTVTFDGTLGDSVFENCSELTHIVFPEGVAYVGTAMFRGCNKVESILFKEDPSKTSTIKAIGAEAFKGLRGFEDLDLPEGLIELKAACFRECDLANVDLSKLHYLRTIGDEVFYANNRYSTVLPESLEHIGANAFNSCNFTTYLRIPANVNYIGAAAFANFNRISVVEIGPQDIAYCGDKIFFENYVREIILPAGVKKIPNNLFNQTTWVTNTPITIPSSVEEIGDGAFSGGGGGNSGNFQITFAEGSQLKRIGNNAFRYCLTLGSIDLPDSLEFIGQEAFADCTNLKGITIPEGVTSLGGGAFARCSLLEEVHYDAIAVTTGFADIFLGCNIKTITIGDKVQLFPDNLFRGAQFQKVSVDSTEYVPVKLTVPASVTRFGSYCLTNVVNLQEISFAPGSNLQTIGEYAFSGCTGLTKLQLPASVEFIDHHAFYGCSAIAGALDLPESLTRIGVAAFSKCEKITNTIIPAGIIEVPNELFFGCKELAVVGFAGNSVTRIGDSAFKDCTKLSGIMLPMGITVLGRWAFQNCVALQRIVIPDGVKRIEAECFKGCTGLTEVSIPKSVEFIDNSAFIPEECGTAVFLVVPGSYAETWLKEHGFTTTNLKEIHYVLGRKAAHHENPMGYKEGDTTELLPASCDGCIFQGWYLDPEFKRPIFSMEGMTGDFTVYAKWEIIRYSLTYVLDGGINNDSNPTGYTVDDNIRFKKATKDGFSWGGWYTDAGFTQPIESIKPGTKLEDLTLYAKFVEGAAATVSAFDNKPVIDEATTELYLVQGQKFTLDGGWTLADPKGGKKFISLNNKGAFKAKKVTQTPVVIKKGDQTINVTIIKPVMEKKFTMAVGDPARKIDFTYDADHMNVYWYSAAPDVATVDQEGQVTARGKGKAKITAYIYGVAYNCTVTVTENETVDRTLHLNMGGNKKLSLTKANKPVWSSDDNDIATMNKNKVTAVAAGHANLTAVMADGASYTVALTVEDITLKTGPKLQAAKGKNKYTLNIKAGETEALSFAFVEQEYVFKSSKPDFAYVDEDGWVIAKAPGKTKLTTKINGKTVTVNVIVSP